MFKAYFRCFCVSLLDKLNNMMHHYKNILFLAISLFLLIACNPQPEASALLKQAELLMENNPDSALLLIDSIFYPEESLNKKEFMDYQIAKVQAKYKTYRPVYDDTLIFKARDYFVKQNKYQEKTTLAHFYSGCVCREQKDYEKAMQAYKDAATTAQKTNDVDLKGLVQYNIGDLLLQNDLYKEALQAYKKAEQFYSKSSKNAEKKRTKCLSAVGHMFLLLNQPDSTFFYLHKGLDLAEKTENVELQSLFLQNLSIAYREIKEYGNAEIFMRQSFQLNNDSSDKVHYYLNFAKLYSLMQKSDSARVYKNKLKQEMDLLDDIYFKASAYNFLANTESADKNYEIAFNHQRERMRLLVDIMEKNKNQSVYEIQKKYDYAKLQNRHDQMILARQKEIILLLAVLLCLSIIAVILFRKTIIQKNKLLKMEQAWQVLNETARDIQKQKPNSIESNNTQREALLWKFDVLQKSYFLKNKMESTPKLTGEKALQEFNNIVYGTDGDSPWRLMHQTFDELNPGLSSIIQKHYPQLSETEFKICLLSYARMRSTEIALILNLSVSTVNMGRTNIRKKMNLKTKGVDFCEVLIDLYTQKG